MDLCLEAARKLDCCSERLVKNANAEPSIKDGMETLRLCASLLRSPLSIDTVSYFSSNCEKTGLALAGRLFHVTWQD
jgi:hypothetical protein